MRAGKLLSRIAAASASRLGSAALTFALFWLLTHRLAPEDLGVFALLTSVFALLQLMPLLGLNVYLSREVTLQPERVTQTVHAHLWFAAPVTALLAMSVAIYGAVAYGGRFALPFGLLALAMLPTGWTTVAESALIGLERLRSVTTTNFVESAWRLLGAVAVLEFGGSLVGVMVVFLVGRCAVAAVYWSHAQLRPAAWGPLAGGTWCTLWKAVPLFLGVMGLSALCSRLDVIALSFLLPIEEAGRYAAGAKLYEAAMMVPSLATMVILPPLARVFASDKDRFARVLPQSVRLLLALGLPLACFGAALAPVVIAGLFPARFAGSVAVVQVLLFAATVAVVDLLLSSVMVASYAQREDFQTLVAGCVVLVLGLVLLLPRMGIVGAAVAVLLHMLTRLAWRAFWARRVLRLDGMVPILAGAAVAAGCGVAALVFAERMGAVVAAVAATSACAIGVWVGQLLRPEDLGAARAVLRKRTAPSPS